MVAIHSRSMPPLLLCPLTNTIVRRNQPRTDKDSIISIRNTSYHLAFEFWLALVLGSVMGAERVAKGAGRHGYERRREGPTSPLREESIAGFEVEGRCGVILVFFYFLRYWRLLARAFRLVGLFGGGITASRDEDRCYRRSPEQRCAMGRECREAYSARASSCKFQAAPGQAVHVSCPGPESLASSSQSLTQCT